MQRMATTSSASIKMLEVSGDVFRPAAGFRLRCRKVASCACGTHAIPELGCRLQVLQVIRLQGRLQANTAGLQAARPEIIVPTGGLVDMVGPDPLDRTISKRKFETLLLVWRNELKAAAALLRGVSV